MAGLEHLHFRIRESQTDHQARPVFICFLGDSNTRGWGNESIQYREAYPTRVIESLHDWYPGCAFNGINSGVDGDTLVRALDRLERDVFRYDPDLTIVCFGVNDAMQGTSHLSDFRQGLKTLVKIFNGESQSDLLFLTPNMMATRVTNRVPQRWSHAIGQFVDTQTNGTLDAFVDTIREIAQNHGVPIADAYAKWKALAATGVDTTLLLANGINHPFGHSHRFFADVIMDTISRFVGQGV